MKRKTKQRIKQAAKSFILDILQLISELPELIPDPFETSSEYKKRLHFLAGGYSRYSYDKISRGLSYLERKDLIKKKKISNKLTYELTITGRQKLLMAQIAAAKSLLKDGTSCIVVFDIPEEKSRHRKFLRRFLLRNGFINLQKSVLIGPQFLPKEFFELLEELGLRQNVTVIKGTIHYS